MRGRSEAASVSGGGSPGDAVDGDGVDRLGGAVGALEVGLAGSSGNDEDSADETAWGASDVGCVRGVNGVRGEVNRRENSGGLPPRQSRQALGQSPSSCTATELDTMMEHIIPNLGHFPRSDASVAFALNELDTLLSDEVRWLVHVWCMFGACLVVVPRCGQVTHGDTYTCRRRTTS